CASNSSATTRSAGTRCSPPSPPPSRPAASTPPAYVSTRPAPRPSWPPSSSSACCPAGSPTPTCAATPPPSSARPPPPSPPPAGPPGQAPDALSPGRMTYALPRLPLHQLIERPPGSHRYHVPDLGFRVALLFTRTYPRLLRPGLAPLTAPPDITGPGTTTLRR